MRHLDEVSGVNDDKAEGTPLLAMSFGATPYRWVVLLVFSLASFGNAYMWINFSAISDLTEEYYNTTSAFVNAQSLVFLIAYPISNFFSAMVLAHWGIRVGISVGAVLTALGACVRCFSAMFSHHVMTSPVLWRLSVLVLGQSLGALGQPFITNAPSAVAAAWFPTSQRVLATSLAIVANTLGAAAGFVLPPEILSSDAENMPALLYSTAGALVLVALLSIVFLRAHPHIPPSISGSEPPAPMTCEAFWSELWGLLTNWSFLCVLFLVFVVLGLTNGMATLSPQMMSKYNYSDPQASFVAGAFIVAGIVGSGVFGVVADATRRYRLILTVLCVLCILSMLVPAGLLHFRWDTLALLVVSNAAVGFFLLPMIPLSFDFAVELTFPIPEPASVGLCIMLAQASGTAFIFGLQGWANEGRADLVFLVYAGSLVPATVACILARGPLRRYELEQAAIVRQEQVLP